MEEEKKVGSELADERTSISSPKEAIPKIGLFRARKKTMVSEESE